MRARFITPVGAALMLTCSLAACGSSGQAGAFQPAGQPASAATQPPSGGRAAADPAAPPATMTAAQINAQVLARYREYQRVYKQIYETNDPAPLASVAIDPLLTIITKDVKETAAKGEIWRFTNVLHPQIQGRSKDGAIVIVLDCVRTLGAYRYSAKTGRRLGATSNGGTRLYQAVMKFTGGTWKISEGRQGKKC
jgi:hypothetical protein